MKTFRQKLAASKTARRIVYHSGLPALQRVWRRSIRRQTRVFILMYHKVGPSGAPYFGASVHPENFERHLRYISRNFTMARLDELPGMIGEKRGREYVVITFDDGFRDNYQWAFPLLRKYGIPATVFLATNFIGSGNMLWPDRLAYLLHLAASSCPSVPAGVSSLPDPLAGFVFEFLAGHGVEARRVAILRKFGLALKHYSEAEKNSFFASLSAIFKINLPDDRERLMLSWDEIREMADHHIDFGAHTVNHVALSRLADHVARRELTESRNMIEEKTQKSVTSFAYPYGKQEDFSIANISQVEDCGFRCACTAIRGQESLPLKNPFILKRRAVENTPYLFL